MTETMPWERQRGESHKAFEAFHEYCLLGNDRSIRKVAQSLNKSVALIGGWSSKWKWKERVVEYDNELIRQEVQTAKEGIAEMRKRHIEIGKYFQSKGIDAIKKKATTDEGLQYEDIKELVAMVTKGMQMEAEARETGLQMITWGEGRARQNIITEERRRELEEAFSDKPED